MRAPSPFFVVIAMALASIATASAQKADQNIKQPVKREKPLRQAKAQAPVQIYCYRNIPCRPVKPGCHLEHNGAGGFNEEICD